MASNMRELVKKEDLIVKDVYPDGNCLFAAVVDQLRIRGEFFFTPRTLRDAAVEYLRNNPHQVYYDILLILFIYLFIYLCMYIVFCYYADNIQTWHLLVIC